MGNGPIFMRNGGLTASLFLLPFLFFPPHGNSQQTDTLYKVSGHSSAVSYRSVHFTDDSSGWVVGDSGVIGHWMPSSNEWADQNSGTDKRLHSVHFPVDDTGWAVGDPGTILHTVDGGNNWISQTAGDSSTLRSVFFTSTDTGWAVGDSGTVLYTEDGGANWAPQPSGTSLGLKAVQFHDASLGWAVGDKGVVLRTTDGGSNWNVHSTKAPTLHDLSFLNDTLGWATGVQGGIVHTEDGGVTWNFQEDSNSWAATYTSIQMLDPSTGWALGNSNVGKLYDPDSGSALWSPVLHYSFFGARSHHFFTVDTGWIAYNGGIGYFTNADSLEYDGIEERDEANMEVKVRPNPFQEEALFRFEGPESPRSFTLYTLQGRQVRRERIRKQKSYLLDRKDLPDGAYIYRFANEKGILESGKLFAR